MKFGFQDQLFMKKPRKNFQGVLFSRCRSKTPDLPMILNTDLISKSSTSSPGFSAPPFAKPKWFEMVILVRISFLTPSILLVSY